MSSLHRKLDIATRRLLFAKEGSRCWAGGCTGRGVDPAHIFGRSYLNTRWDTDEQGNVHILCRECHELTHRHASLYEDWYVERFGEESLEGLRRRAYAPYGALRNEQEWLLKRMEAELVRVHL